METIILEGTKLFIVMLGLILTYFLAALTGYYFGRNK
ncbi:hypothetical protein LCGC14_0641380 [marine sediment metagenome]|uniref:Uncharacterized protein n=1 Tax=marine sediment metagenome TaxID=412755 RepID=A0A0F9U7F3_9ZZZZ